MRKRPHTPILGASKKDALSIGPKIEDSNLIQVHIRQICLQQPLVLDYQTIYCTLCYIFYFLSEIFP